MADETGAGAAHPRSGELVPFSAQALPGDLALWSEHATAVEIATVPFESSELNDLTITGPFELTGRQVDGATLAVMFAAGSIRQAVSEAGPREVQPVRISL